MSNIPGRIPGLFAAGPVRLEELEILDEVLALFQLRAVEYRQTAVQLEIARSRYKLAAVVARTRDEGKELP